MARHIAVTREVELWRKRCPLYVWLKSSRGKRFSAKKLAHRFNRSRQAVYAWLHGVALPNTRVIQELRQLTGITLDAWVRWFGEAPAEELTTCAASTSTDSSSTDDSGEN